MRSGSVTCAGRARRGARPWRHPRGDPGDRRPRGRVRSQGTTPRRTCLHHWPRHRRDHPAWRSPANAVSLIVSRCHHWIWRWRPVGRWRLAVSAPAGMASIEPVVCLHPAWHGRPGCAGFVWLISCISWEA